MLYVSVTLLRHAGRRRSENEQPETVEGVLTIGPRGGMLIAEIRAPLMVNSTPLAALYDVRLIDASDCIRLRGFEQHGNSGVLQEWVCAVVDTSHGIDRRTMRPLPCPAMR